jgi:hypothetical protein
MEESMADTETVPPDIPEIPADTPPDERTVAERWRSRCLLAEKKNREYIAVMQRMSEEAAELRLKIDEKIDGMGQAIIEKAKDTCRWIGWAKVSRFEPMYRSVLELKKVIEQATGREIEEYT